MAFPTTGVLDTFTRDDEDLSDSANWTEGRFVESGTGFAVVSNVCEQTGGTNTTASADWNDTFGADSEAYWTVIGTAPDFDGDRHSLFARAVDLAGTEDGYGVNVRLTGASQQARIQRIDAGVDTDIGTNTNMTFNDGDGLGIEIIGTTITSYRFDTSTWASVHSTTDSTYTAAGAIGIYDFEDGGTNPTWDGFGGGTVVAAGGANPKGPLGGVVMAGPLGGPI